MKNNPHAEAGGSACNRLPDPAETDKAEGFAVDVMAQKHFGSPCFELSCTSEFVALDDTSSGGHEEGPGKVGGSFGENTGGVCDGDAELCCRFDGDVIESDGKVRDDF